VQVGRHGVHKIMITLTREEAQQVLDAIVLSMPMFVGHSKQHAAAIETLRTRLAQPEPEPVAWGIANTRPTEKHPLMMVMTYKPEPSSLVVPLYTAPPQREWQGLTTAETKALWNATKKPTEFAEMLQAKLREKNE
jgi:hypothetical protein